MMAEFEGEFIFICILIGRYIYLCICSKKGLSFQHLG